MQEEIMPEFLKEDEKKVEYIELIYDLIFVYLIGRNNSLVQDIERGFIRPELFLTYVLCTLITIQIWYTTTLFINRHGSNHIQEYIGLFINMFLLYYMADGTRVHWSSTFYKYNTAWLLILVNIGVQYYLKYREVSRETPWEAANLLYYIRLLAIQSGIVLIGMLLYKPLGIPLTPLAMIFGLVMTVLGRERADLVALDFTHLTERIMLYIVFSFGEMIIAVSIYFSGRVTANGIYYALMAFLIVVGLFMSYGFFYDRLLDREMMVSGNAYMCLHVFIIFALSCLTTALEFMPEDLIATIPKTIFLVASFVVYYLFLFLAFPYTKNYEEKKGAVKPFVITLVLFVLLMAVFHRHPHINIAVSVGLTFVVWYLLHRYERTGEQE